MNPQIHNQNNESTYFTTSNTVYSDTGCSAYACQYTVQCLFLKELGYSGDWGIHSSNTITIKTKSYCSTVSCYSKSSVSNPSSYTVEQYSGTSNINSQTAVSITEFFTIPDNTCSFSSCSMYSGITLDSSVTVVYTGSGSTATVVFKITTSSSFSTKNLNLGCSISGSTSIAYSSNTIAFAVSPCTLTGISPILNSYTYIQVSGINTVIEYNLEASNYFTGLSSTCYFQSCQFGDSSLAPSSIVTVSMTGSAPSQTFTFATSTSISFTTKTLYLKCLVASSTSTYVTSSYAISFTVTPCTLTSLIPTKLSYVYNYKENSGSIQATNPVSNYFSGLTSDCYFQSCAFLSPSSIVTDLKLKCFGIDSVYYTNSNQISFQVKSCEYTSLLPPSYSLEQYQNGSSLSYKDLKLSSFISSQQQTCTLSNCQLVDSLGKNPSFASFTFSPGSSSYILKISTIILTSRYEKGSTSIKLRCYDIQSNKQESQFFSIQVLCGAKSVDVRAPNNLKEITYYLIKQNEQATYIYDNFTSSNSTDCPIISHKISTSTTTLTSPSYITIIEGKQQFQIKNLSMSNSTFNYTFYIIATAQGGANLKQKVFIQNIDCDDDVISLIQTFPDKSDPNFKLFVIKDKFPVLKINQSAEIQFKASIKQRFTNILSDFCPLTDFRISKIICNNKQNQEFQNYFMITKSGVLQTIYQPNTIIQNCHVYLEAFNSKKWGGHKKQYIADISLYEEKLSQISSFLNQNKTIKQQQQVKNGRIKQMIAGNSSIDHNGLLTIKFNQQLIVPDIIQYALDLQSNNSAKNLSVKNLKNFTNQTNDSILSLKNIMDFKIEVQSNYLQEELEFSVKLENWTSSQIQIQLNFTHPELISQGKSYYDKLNIIFQNASLFRFKNPLYDSNENLKDMLATIPPQNTKKYSLLVQIIESSSKTSFNIVFTVSLVLQSVLKAGKVGLKDLFLNLQIQKSISYFQVSLPQYSTVYIQIIKSVAEFEYLKPQNLMQMAGLNITVQEILKIQTSQIITSNLQNARIQSDSIILNISQYLFIFFVAIILFMMLAALYIIPYSREKIKGIIMQIVKDLKFKTVTIYITGAFLDLSFSVVTQILVNQNENWNYINKSKSSLIATWLIFFAQLSGYITACFYVLYKNRNNLKDEKFNETYGEMIQGLNTEDKNSIYVYPVFMLKRLIFTLIVLVFYNKPAFQIHSLIILQFSHIVFIIKTRTCRLYKQFVMDIVNETCLILMFYHLLLFGDTGIINGSETRININFKIQFVQNMSFSFDSVGTIILIFNFANFALSIGKSLMKTYEEYQEKKEKETQINVKEKKDKQEIENQKSQEIENNQNSKSQNFKQYKEQLQEIKQNQDTYQTLSKLKKSTINSQKILPSNQQDSQIEQNLTQQISPFEKLQSYYNAKRVVQNVLQKIQEIKQSNKKKKKKKKKQQILQIQQNEQNEKYFFKYYEKSKIENEKENKETPKFKKFIIDPQQKKRLDKKMEEFKQAAAQIETPGLTDEQMRFYLRREDPKVEKISDLSSGWD